MPPSRRSGGPSMPRGSCMYRSYRRSKSSRRTCLGCGVFMPALYQERPSRREFQRRRAPPRTLPFLKHSRRPDIIAAVRGFLSPGIRRPNRNPVREMVYAAKNRGDRRRRPGRPYGGLRIAQTLRHPAARHRAVQPGGRHLAHRAVQGNHIGIGGHRFPKSDRVRQWLDIMPWSRPPSRRSPLVPGPVRSVERPARSRPETIDQVMLIRPRKSRIYWRRNYSTIRSAFPPTPSKDGPDPPGRAGLNTSARRRTPVTPERNLRISSSTGSAANSTTPSSSRIPRRSGAYHATDPRRLGRTAVKASPSSRR